MPQATHRTFRLPRPLIGSLAGAMLAACATVPNANQAIDQPTASETPRLVSARGPLSESQSKAVLSRIETEARPSDVLARHLAIEEAIAETPLVVGNKTTVLR